MMCKPQLIAAKKGLGSVFLCRSCSQVHLVIGPITIRLEAAAYRQLIELLNRSRPAFQASDGFSGETFVTPGTNESIQ